MVNYSYNMPQTREQAIAMIRRPIGSTVPYDFKSVEHLRRFINEDLADDHRPIVLELREIIDSTLEGNPPQQVRISSRQLRRLEQQVWEMCLQFDGYLTFYATSDLSNFLQAALRAKYVPSFTYFKNLLRTPR